MSTIQVNVDEEALRVESYRKVLPQMQALMPGELLTVNLDINPAVTTVLGALPQIMTLKSRMEKEAAGVAVENVTNLEDYARAASYTDTRYDTACKPPTTVDAVRSEGTALRANLNADATAVCLRGLINPEALRALRGGNGDQNLAADLQTLSSVLKDNWPLIEGKCTTSLAELDHAEKLALRLERLIGEREQAPAVRAVATEERQRAYTLFVRAYDQVRRGVQFLRWSEQDADDIAPSLFAGRGNRRKAAPEPTEPEPLPEPPVPVASGGNGSPEPSAPKKTVGLPDSDPFMKD